MVWRKGPSKSWFYRKIRKVEWKIACRLKNKFWLLFPTQNTFSLEQKNTGLPSWFSLQSWKLDFCWFFKGFHIHRWIWKPWKSLKNQVFRMWSQNQKGNPVFFCSKHLVRLLWLGKNNPNLISDLQAIFNSTFSDFRIYWVPYSRFIPSLAFTAGSPGQRDDTSRVCSLSPCVWGDALNFQSSSPDVIKSAFLANSSFLVPLPVANRGRIL